MTLLSDITYSLLRKVSLITIISLRLCNLTVSNSSLSEQELIAIKVWFLLVDAFIAFWMIIVIIHLTAFCSICFYITIIISKCLSEVIALQSFVIVKIIWLLEHSILVINSFIAFRMWVVVVVIHSVVTAHMLRIFLKLASIERSI